MKIDRRGRGTCLALAACALLLASPPAGATAKDCDRLAADPSDIARVGPGVPDGRIDAAAATAACEAAVAAQ